MGLDQAAILIGFLLICLFHSLILDHKDLQQRLQRFYATMISKKIFVWFVITGMFIYDTYVEVNGQFQYWEYLTFTSVVFGLDISQKFVGMRGK